MDQDQFRTNFIDDIPLTSVLKRFLSFWYLFLAALAISVSIAFLYARAQQNTYQVKARLRLNNQGTNNKTAESFMKEIDLLMPNEQVEDEMGVLTSHSLMEQAVEKLSLGVSFYQSGFWVDQQLNDNTIPFFVDIDPNHHQLVGVPIYISLLNQKIVVYVSEKSAMRYLPVTNKNGEWINDIEIRQYARNGELVHEHLAFRIYPNPEFVGNIEGMMDEYYFVIHSKDQLIRSHQQKLGVSPVAEDGNLLELTSSGPFIEEEKAFLDTLLSVYLANEHKRKQSVGQGIINLIDNKIEAISDSLKKVEDRLELFRAQSNIMDLSTTSGELTKQLLELEGEKSKIEGQNQQYKLILNYLEGQQHTTRSVAPSAINVDDPILTPIWNQLTNLYQQRSNLQQSAKADNPQMQRLEREIEDVRRQLTENARNRVRASNISLRKVNERVGSTQSQIDRLPKSEKRLRQLERQYTVVDQTYQYLLQKRAETSIALGNTGSSKDVVDRAYLTSPKPVAPNKLMMILIAALAGIAFPLSGILMLDYFDHRIQGLRDIYLQTDIPVLGIIAKSDSGTRLLNPQQSDPTILECFRALRIQLKDQLDHVGKETHMVGVTSTWANEGKTFTSANLSCALAMAGHKTVLVDLDLRKPSLGDYFSRQDNHKGITSYLNGAHEVTEIIHATHLPHLEYISAGPPHVNALDHIESPQFMELIEALKTLYDYVVLDTPPIGQTSDYIYFKELVDFTLFIVRHKQTPKQSLSHIHNLYQSGKIPDVGIVINDVSNKAAFGLGDGVYGYGKKLEY